MKMWQVGTISDIGTVRAKVDYRSAISDDGGLFATVGDEGVEVYSVRMTAHGTREVETAMKVETLDSLWVKLGNEDAARAQEAAAMLFLHPRAAIAVIRSKLSPAPGLDGKKIDKLIGDLESNQFLVRSKAREELIKLPDSVPFLQKRLAENPPLDVSLQIQEVLRKHKCDPGVLRMSRSIEILEHIGNPEAKEVLTALGAGAEDALLTEEARASLSRLGKR
jgi:hypothetical protein